MLAFGRLGLEGRFYSGRFLSSSGAIASQTTFPVSNIPQGDRYKSFSRGEVVGVDVVCVCRGNVTVGAVSRGEVVVGSSGGTRSFPDRIPAGKTIPGTISRETIYTRENGLQGKRRKLAQREKTACPR